MDNYCKISLYGDSLSLARPDMVNSDERYFYKILEHYKQNCPTKIIETIQRSKASITSTELVDLIYHDNVYYNWYGELCIIHFGIVDCAPRPVNNETRKKIGKLPLLLKKLVIRYLHKNRRKILLSGNANYITPPKYFQANMKSILKTASANYNKVFVINICPTNSETEDKSPGLTKAIETYNDIIGKEIAVLEVPNVKLIDINNLIKSSKDHVDQFIVKEDGHHITPKTHQLLFDKIIECM